MPQLYGRNTFVVAHSYLMRCLPELLLPEHLNRIRSLRFIWDYDGPPPFPPIEGSEIEVPCFENMAWNMVWDNLSGMQGLDKLEVKLFVSGRSWEYMDQERAAMMLQPVIAVTQPLVFRIFL